MARDPRDTLSRKTPAEGSSAAEVESHLAAIDADLDRRDGHDRPTPVGMAVVNERTRGISNDTLDIRTRVSSVEGELSRQGIVLAVLDTKVDIVVDESKASRLERIEREKRAETRAESELAFRRERSFKVIAIVVPTLMALGALVAGIISAYNSSGGK